MLKEWPDVQEEFLTLAKVAEGYSIARFGDGEGKIMRGMAYVREPVQPELAQMLRTIISAPHDRCLIGIPTMNPQGPKYEGWQKRLPLFLADLSPTVQYYSAFITRPDSAPWIETLTYARQLESCWAGRKVAIVCEPWSKLLSVVKITARKVVHIPCPSHNAFAHLAGYEQLILKSHAEIALLSHGVSATVLAHRLASQGMWALDLGSIGGMLTRLLLNDTSESPVYVVLWHPEHPEVNQVRQALKSAGFRVEYCVGQK